MLKNYRGYYIFFAASDQLHPLPTLKDPQKPPRQKKNQSYHALPEHLSLFFFIIKNKISFFLTIF